jgi:hypothetical protein
MPHQSSPHPDPVNNDDLPPLLASWERFRVDVLGEDAGGLPKLTPDMLTFYAGASVIVALIRNAQAQGGPRGATAVFLNLGDEVDAFDATMETVKATRWPN